MKKSTKRYIAASAAFILAFGIAPSANAMHIMEGYLPAGFCVAWGVVCLPFLLAGFRSIQKTLKADRKALPLLAMAGAFVFVISSLKIPSVTGSCSHMTGTGLGALLFGPLCCQYLRHYRTVIPGDSAGSRRTDHSGRQHLFHGCCRPLRVLRYL